MKTNIEKEKYIFNNHMSNHIGIARSDMTCNVVEKKRKKRKQ